MPRARPARKGPTVQWAQLRVARRARGERTPVRRLSAFPALLAATAPRRRSQRALARASAARASSAPRAPQMPRSLSAPRAPTARWAPAPLPRAPHPPGQVRQVPSLTLRARLAWPGPLALPLAPRRSRRVCPASRAFTAPPRPQRPFFAPRAHTAPAARCPALAVPPAPTAPWWVLLRPPRAALPAPRAPTAPLARAPPRPALQAHTALSVLAPRLPAAVQQSAPAAHL